MVVGPAIGGAIFAHVVAQELDLEVKYNILAAYSEKQPDGTFLLKRGYDELVKGRHVIVVEDILTTGGSAAETVKAVRRAGGIVIGLCAIVNRGGVTREQLDVPEFHALLDVNLDSWTRDECPLCKKCVQVNTNVGHGREFLLNHGP